MKAKVRRPIPGTGGQYKIGETYDFGDSNTEWLLKGGYVIPEKTVEKAVAKPENAR